MPKVVMTKVWNGSYTPAMKLGQHAPICTQDRVNIPIVKHQLRAYSFLAQYEPSL
jgi:hypothetical protein